MSTALATSAPSIEGLEQVLINGDLTHLSPEQAITYYQRVCESVGLNPLTQPFEYLKLNGKMILYARRAATEQLRRLHNVSIVIVARETVDGCYNVTARASLPSGRTDEDLGSVSITGLRGESLSNAMMKAITKAKRRVTLGICGLAFLDESEAEGLPGAERVPVPQPAPKQLAEVVPLRTEPVAPDTEEQTTAELFGTVLRAQKTEAELVQWMRDVIASDFEEGTKRTLWRMFRHHALALKHDPNLLMKTAQTPTARGPAPRPFGGQTTGTPTPTTTTTTTTTPTTPATPATTEIVDGHADEYVFAAKGGE